MPPSPIDEPRSAIVIGAGPAGLTAAYELARLGVRPIVLEKSGLVGGLARTEQFKGFYFDMGGHRFFTKVGAIQAMWREILSDEFLVRPRMSRIYYRNRFFHYPLKPGNALQGLGPVEGLRILLSYLRWRAFPHRREETFEQWVTNRFGRRLFETFFKSYTEKVWGIPCSVLKAEWAAQRIRDLSLSKAIFGMWKSPGTSIRSLIDEFYYPRRGPGQLWNAVKDRIEDLGGEVRLDSEVVAIRHRGLRIEAIEVRTVGRTDVLRGDEFISSMPITELIRRLDPAPPGRVLEAAAGLKYRDFLTVCLIVNRPRVFDDNWLYIHDPEVKVGRIQNYKNWSADMVPDPSKTSLGLEYFCTRGDAIWSRPDRELVELGRRELERIALVAPGEVEDGCVFRVPMAYPIYDADYRESLLALRSHLEVFENLQTIGRNGLHRYNNQDHSMLTGLLAVRNLLYGEDHDLWEVNADREYHEEIRKDRPDRDPRLGPSPSGSAPRGDRLLPHSAG